MVRPPCILILWLWLTFRGGNYTYLWYPLVMTKISNWKITNRECKVYIIYFSGSCFPLFVNFPQGIPSPLTQTLTARVNLASTGPHLVKLEESDGVDMDWPWIQTGHMKMIVPDCSITQPRNFPYLVGDLEHVLFSHSVGNHHPNWRSIFFRGVGLNHQPDP